MNKILVTGSAGLIGSELVKKLRQNGNEVIDCDIRFTNNSLSFFSEQVQPLLEKCNGIIHLAAISRVIHGVRYPQLSQKVNVTGTLKFLEFYKKLSHKPWFIYGSSREVYGEQEVLPVSENAKLNPINKYAEGKILIENMVSNLRNSGFNTAILRFSNVYGGLLDHFDRVIPAFCIKALKNESIRIDGKECLFDFTYLEDVIEGILLTVDYLQSSWRLNSPIHFTSGNGCNLEELANIILKITNSSSPINYQPPRNFDVSRFYGDFSTAKRLLGWIPKNSLEKGLSKFILNIQNTKEVCSNNVEMVIYEDIKSYSWLPTLL